MERIQIMILGSTTADIHPVTEQLSHIPEWEVHAFSEKEEAVSFFQQRSADVVIFTDAVDVSVSTGLGKLFRFQEENVVLLSSVTATTHIREAVNEALYREASPGGFRIIDNALMAAGISFHLN